MIPKNSHITVLDSALEKWNMEPLAQKLIENTKNGGILFSEQSPDQRLAVAYENIFEGRMDSYAGDLLLLESPESPKIRLKVRGMDPYHHETYRHFLGKYLLMITSPVSSLWNGSYTPLIINLEKNIFSFIENKHGYAFEFAFTPPNTLTSIQLTSYKIESYKKYNLGSLDWKRYDLDQLKWFPIEEMETHWLF